MPDTNDLARDALVHLTSSTEAPDATILGAVHDGLLSVPADGDARTSVHDDAPHLAVRRRTGF